MAMITSIAQHCEINRVNAQAHDDGMRNGQGDGHHGYGVLEHSQEHAHHQEKDHDEQRGYVGLIDAINELTGQPSKHQEAREDHCADENKEHQGRSLGRLLHGLAEPFPVQARGFHEGHRRSSQGPVDVAGSRGIGRSHGNVGAEDPALK